LERYLAKLERNSYICEKLLICLYLVYDVIRLCAYVTTLCYLSLDVSDEANDLWQNGHTW